MTEPNNQNPFTICQDHEKLLSIKSFSFDLEDKEFIQYFKSRTGIIIDWPEAWEQIRTQLKSPYPSELKWISILRARIQDCWGMWEIENI